jgi:hypothetical protein
VENGLITVQAGSKGSYRLDRFDAKTRQWLPQNPVQIKEGNLSLPHGESPGTQGCLLRLTPKS